MASLVTENTTTTTTTTNQNDMESYDNNNNVNTINNLLQGIYSDNSTPKAKKQAMERIAAIVNFEMTKVDKNVDSEPQHFEDLPGIIEPRE